MEKEKKTMRAVILEEYKSKPIVKEIPIPVPKSGQVLIKMEASGMNPSDVTFLSGKYSTKKQPPTVPGFEGAGTVIQSGGGIMAWRLVGKRVAVAANDSLPGCWAEYMVTDALRCFPIDDNVSFKEAGYAFANPLTTLAMLDLVKQEKHQAIIQTAACSAVGRMIARHFQANKIRVINIVRRKEQEDILRKEDGAEFTLNSEDKDFEDQLKKLAHELKATCCFEAVGGELTGKCLRNMPPKSTIYVYGFLSMQQIIVDPRDLFEEKVVTGFWLSVLIKKKSLLSTVLTINTLKNHLKTTLRTEIDAEYALEDVWEAVEEYKKTKKKVIILPWKKPKELSSQTKAAPMEDTIPEKK